MKWGIITDQTGNFIAKLSRVSHERAPVTFGPSKPKIPDLSLRLKTFKPHTSPRYFTKIVDQ